MGQRSTVIVVTAVLLAVLLPAAHAYTRPDQGEVLIWIKYSCLRG